MANQLTITVTLDQAEKLLGLIKNENTAYKNWIAQAVEHSDMTYAKTLVESLREYETLFVCVNGPILRAKGVL